MTPERWARIKQVFEAALDTPEERRGELLDQTCGSDTELRHEVESLLRQNSVDSVPARGCDELTAGARLGPYQILSRVGAGGMGTIYKAQDTRLGRLVAIKMVRPEAGSRFQREARIVAELNHPHICSLYDVGPSYLVMEFLEGRTLAARLREGPLCYDEILRYGGQIAAALEAAHVHGVVHRDLKPANIMLTGSGAKVLDFGLAKRETSDSAQSAEGTVAGTPGYMSPEQAEGRPVDPRSDIFSFGAVLYEMATGRPAFQGESCLATVAAVLRADPPIHGVAPELARLIQDCLAKDASQRLPHAWEVKAALAKMHRETLQPPVQRKLWRWVAAAALLVGAAVAVWRWQKPVPADPVAAPLTGLPGLALYPSFSPDGKKVAFSWNGDQQNNLDVYIKQIGNAGQLRLTTDQAPDTDPVWSPDDRYIAFTRAQPGGIRAVMLISPFGGPERKIAEVISDAGVDSRLCWTPDGKFLAVAAHRSGNEPSTIWLYSVDTGERRQLTDGGAADHDFQPSISPDGKWLAFSRGNKAGFQVRPYVQRLARGWKPAGEPRSLCSEAFHFARGVAWAPDSESIVYSAGTETRLWRIPLSGSRPPSLLNFVAAEALYPAISPGRTHRLAYSWRIRNINLRRLDTRTGERKPFIVLRGIQILPQYSPDGKKIAFQSTSSGVTQVYTCDADGINCVQLTFGEGFNGRPRWSPDRRWLSIGSQFGGDHQVRIIPAEGGVPRPLTFGPGDRGSASWSHDGRWVYFTTPTAGAADIWKIPVAGGEATRVTFQRGAYPIASPDGKYIYFTKGERGGSLFRMPAEGGPEETGPLVNSPGAWALSREGVYFVAPGEPLTLRFQDFATRQVRVIADYDGGDGGLAVSPDGVHVVYPYVAHIEASVMLVENFR
jgi:Tol biopolymer transport system component